MEIDPLLKKGIRLLFSKSRDSLDQLKALADEALYAKHRSSTSKLVSHFLFCLLSYVYSNEIHHIAR